MSRFSAQEVIGVIATIGTIILGIIGIVMSYTTTAQIKVTCIEQGGEWNNGGCLMDKSTNK